MEPEQGEDTAPPHPPCPRDGNSLSGGCRDRRRDHAFAGVHPALSCCVLTRGLGEQLTSRLERLTLWVGRENIPEA